MCRESRQQRARIVFLRHDMQVNALAAPHCAGDCPALTTACTVHTHLPAGMLGSWAAQRCASGSAAAARAHFASRFPPFVPRWHECFGTLHGALRHGTIMSVVGAPPLGICMLKSHHVTCSVVCCASPAVQDAFDWPSDIARMYKLKSAPRFLFFVDVSCAAHAGLLQPRAGSVQPRVPLPCCHPCLASLLCRCGHAGCGRARSSIAAMAGRHGRLAGLVACVHACQV